MAKKAVPRPAGSPKDWGIGEIAIYNKLLAPEKLEECVKLQRAMAEVGFRMPIGQILIEKYYLDAATVRALIRAKSEISPDFDPSTEQVNIVKLTPNEHETLVERVRERKLVPPEVIDECFDLQCHLLEFGIDKDLGEILLEKGYVQKAVIQDILTPAARTKARLQREVVNEESQLLLAASDASTTRVGAEGAFRRGDKFALPENRRLLFGRIAAEKGLLTEDQVEECLFVQFKLKELGVIKRLGEVMVEKKFLERNDVKRILAIQKQLHGKIKWVDKNLTVSQKREDVLLQQLLLKNEILGPEEVNECLFVQHVMRKLGIEKNLAAVIVDKEYLEPEVVRGILREFKRAQEESIRRAREEKDELAARTAETGFVFADVKLKKAYLDILQSRKPDDLSASVDRRVEPLRSTTPSTRHVPLWPAAALLGVLATAGFGWLVWRGSQSHPIEDGGAAAADASPPPSGALVVDTGRTTPVDPVRTDDPPDEGPGTEAPYLAELRRAATALVYPAGTGPDHEAKKTLAIVAASPARVDSLPSACFFVYRAHFWLPAGATLKSELFYRGSQSVGATQILSVAADGTVQSWFGPFSSQPPEQLFGEFASPWALCGPYTVRFTFHLPSQSDEVQRACRGIPFLDESGAAVVDHVFHHPSRETHEREGLAQERFLTSRLREMLAYLEKARATVGERAVAHRTAAERGRRDGPEFEALLRSAAELREALDQVRAALENLGDNLLANPQPNLFRLLDDLLETGGRLAEHATRPDAEPGDLGPAARRFDQLDRTLRTYLGS